MKLTGVPKIISCLVDNYAYLLEVPQSSDDKKEPLYVLIDAPDFDPIDSFLEKHHLQLDCILSTHHHADHINANLALKEKYKCKIYGAQEDFNRIPGIDYPLKPGEIFKIGNTEVQSMTAPGHTSHHTIYFFPQFKILFSGDSLFSMGCGRLFEGSYLEMYETLQKIKTLPDLTKLYCGHEYSKKNGQFALSVGNNNEALQRRFQEALKLRANGEPTVPTTLSLEKQINPFLMASSVDEFTNLRQLRDMF